MSATVTPITHRNNIAIREVVSRFVIVPTTDTRPKFRDTYNMQVAPQGNPMMLLQAYRDSGGNDDQMSGELLLNQLPVVFAETFRPGTYQRVITENGNRLLNLWTAPDVLPSGAVVSTRDAAPFIDFLKRLFPIDAERLYFRDWLAHAVRYPDRRINATVLLRSEHGVGKGFMAETLLPGLLGKASVGTVALGNVVGTFNDALVGKTLIMIDEVYKNPETTVNTLKSIQGNQTIVLRRKYTPDTSVDNYLNFIMTSNEVMPLPLEREDRRFWIPAYIYHKVSKSETMEFINKRLKPWLVSDGGMQIVRDLLETIDLSDFQPWGDPPMTDSKKEMVGISSSDELGQFVADYIASQQVVKAMDIETLYRAQTGKSLGNRAVPTELSRLGCRQKRTSSLRAWITPSGQAAGLSGSSTPTDLQQAYAA